MYTNQVRKADTSEGASMDNRSKARIANGIIAAVITAMYALAYLPWALMDQKNQASS